MAKAVQTRGGTIVGCRYRALTIRRLISGIVPLRPCLACRSYSARKKAATVTSVAPADEQLNGDIKEDAYYVASKRFHTLLHDAALSNKDTVPIDFIDACNVEERLTLFANLSTLTILLAFIVCWLFGEYDPLGGMWFDKWTLDSAMLGVLYAMPLVLCSIASRSSLNKPFPVLREMHEMQHDLFKHFTSGMTVPQVCILITFVLLPSLVLLMPASKAVLVWAGAFIQQALLQTWGSGVHIKPLHLGPLGLVLPPVLSSYVAGLVSASCFNVRPKQIEVVRDALRNADAFFRLTGAPQQPSVASTPRRPPAALDAASPTTMFATSTLAVTSLEEEEEDYREIQDLAGAASTSGSTAGSQSTADAFRAVAMVWFLTRRRVARLSYILTSLDVAYLGVIWQTTGNLATPAAAAFLHAAAEVWLGEWQANQVQAAKLATKNTDMQQH